MINRTTVSIFIIMFFVIGHLESQTKPKLESKLTKKDTVAIEKSPLITFIELGSVKCIPCKMMQPVMKSIEEKYGEQIKIIFYDVWKEEQAIYSQIYKIRLIPTQVFLDKHGKEIHRHEGFYPEKEIDAFLQSQGLKPKKLK